MNARDEDELVKELLELLKNRNKDESDIYLIAQYILNDRKRIVEPLVTFDTNPLRTFDELKRRKDKVLKLSGEKL